LIVLDTSALMAILLSEDDQDRLHHAVAEADRIVIGAPTKLEFYMVANGRLRENGIPKAKAILEAYGVECLDWTEEMAEIARDAFLRFGKGQGHPAQLNFGDCMAYAVAKSLNAPLLFKGDDFSQTDIAPAL
jgi:ribonuclease VapC